MVKQLKKTYVSLIKNIYSFFTNEKSVPKKQNKPKNEKAGRVNLYKIDVTGFKELKIITPADASDPAWSPLIP